MPHNKRLAHNYSNIN